MRLLRGFERSSILSPDPPIPFLLFSDCEITFTFNLTA